ncbi:MAG: hypothetical protein ACRD2D_06475 [Terriglobales bacterium]
MAAFRARVLLGAFALFWLVLALPATAQVHHRTEVSGRVLDADNQPVAAVMVELHAWNGATIASQMTNAAGRFDFEVGADGPFQIEIGPNGDADPMPVYAGNLTNLQLKLSAPANAYRLRTSPTVSLNDLEAPSKARSKLAEANKALRKLNLAKAWKLANEAISAAPNWGKAYLVRGVLSMESRNYESAQQDLATAVERDPHSAIALTELGKLYSTTGHFEMSDLYLRRALAIEPVLWPTYFEMADLDLKRGNYSEAEKMAEYSEFSTPPAPPPSHFLAGEAAFHLHDWKTAQIEFRSFLALTPPTPGLVHAIATAKLRLEDIEAAASPIRR